MNKLNITVRIVNHNVQKWVHFYCYINDSLNTVIGSTCVDT